MDTSLTIAPALPWKVEKVLVFAEAENGAQFIITLRAEAPRYVVHRYDPSDNSCRRGSYRLTYFSAWNAFMDRFTTGNADAL